MTLLLDTCTLLWLASEQSSLSDIATKEIRLNPDSLAISAITAFEIALKHRKRRLTLPIPPEKWMAGALEQHGIREIPIDGAIAARSALLPPHHSDPCDRMIVATALLHSMTILTPDRLIRRYKVRTLW